MTEPESHSPFAPPKAQEYDQPNLIDSGVDFARLHSVGHGLNHIYLALLLLVVLIAAVGIPGFMPVNRPPWLPTAGGVVGVVCFLMFAVGLSLCLSVPAESGAGGIILVATLLHFFFVFATFYGGVSRGGAGLVFVLVEFVVGVLFVAFMRKLASYIQQRRLASRAGQILIFTGLVAISSLLLTLNLFRFGTVTPAGSILLQVLQIVSLPLTMLLWLVVLLMFANLTNQLSRAIRRSEKPMVANHVGEDRS